ncbi:MAG: hypothetical protein HWN66_14310 [Candidatus Helarchaeota archaeon]|nr:hypothetical protein [Candidatus Helarchaeota archaeon]
MENNKERTIKEITDGDCKPTLEELKDALDTLGIGGYSETEMRYWDEAEGFLRTLTVGEIAKIHKMCIIIVRIERIVTDLEGLKKYLDIVKLNYKDISFKRWREVRLFLSTISDESLEKLRKEIMEKRIEGLEKKLTKKMLESFNQSSKKRGDSYLNRGGYN